MDGLGRPIQSIAKQAGGNKEDIITTSIYDNFGRQVKQYLPYADVKPIAALSGFHKPEYIDDKS